MQQPTRRARAKVLVVDDDVAVLDVLMKSLEELGYAVERALHGADALMAIGSDRPDVVLLDIRMDGLGGVEVLTRIRSLDPTLPVIMVTGNGDPQLIRQTREIGAYGYLVKPVELDRLNRVVSDALIGSR